MCIRDSSKKRVWYTYNGAEVGHQVMPFTGERISIVLYKRGTDQGGGTAAACVKCQEFRIDSDSEEETHYAIFAAGGDARGPSNYRTCQHDACARIGARWIRSATQRRERIQSPSALPPGSWIDPQRRSPCEAHPLRCGADRHAYRSPTIRRCML